LVVAGVLVSVVLVVLGVVLLRFDTTEGTGQREAPGLEVRPATAEDEPAGLVTSADPICEDHNLVSGILAGRWQSFGQIDHDLPARSWTPGQRDIAEATARAMLSAAGQYESMLPRAQNRVIQEMLAQTIVYLRMNAANMPDYQARSDAYIAYVVTALDGAVGNICSAVPEVKALPDSGARPTSVAADPRGLVPFMEVEDGICEDLVLWAERRDEELNWEAYNTDMDVAASQWTPEQRAVAADAAKVLARNVGEIREFAERAENPMVRDFLFTAVPYYQLIAERLPNYKVSDGPLWTVAFNSVNAVRYACQI